MTAPRARTIVRENDDELGYWIEVNRESMFAGLGQKLAAVALLFQALAAFPQVAKGGYRRGRQHADGSRASKPSGVGERDRRAGTGP
jgi:hypothetical protein